MRNGPKKIIEFAGKFCSFERRRYLCTTKPIRWIHLRVRIRASHARHRGSNPLSTTRLPNGRTQVRSFSVSSCRCRPSADLWGWVGAKRNCVAEPPAERWVRSRGGNCRQDVAGRESSAGTRQPECARHKPPGGKLPQPPHEGRLRLRFRLSVGWWVTFPVCL